MEDGPAAPRQRRRLKPKLRAPLLGLWFALSFCVPFFARDLRFEVAGWPFHYWFAAQGGLLAFIAILAFHAALARRIDDKDDDDEAQGPPPELNRDA